MAERLLAITSEYVRTYLALCRMEIGWPKAVREQLDQLRLDMLDLLHVVKEGELTQCQETDHGTKMVVEGYTCDEVLMRVELWVDFDASCIRIEKIQLV